MSWARYFLLVTLLATLCCETACSTDDEGKTGLASPKFNYGVNFIWWFQAESVEEMYYDRFSKSDFEHIAQMGGGIVRLPISFDSMTSGAPDYTIDPNLLARLDFVIEWAEDAGIYLIIDNHLINADNGYFDHIEPFLTKVWTQLAERYKDRSELILYEICNEPHTTTDQAWGEIQQAVIDAIRQKDTKHTIIVTSNNWSNYAKLEQLPCYTDDNLIYTFHFYDPMIFTHQAADWEHYRDIRNLPFPYDADRMPVLPTGYEPGWVKEMLDNQYVSIGKVSALKEAMDLAIAFRDSRNVRIFCGELGVLMDSAPATDRIFWYETVTSMLRENQIPYTLWDYKYNFGLFNTPNSQKFPEDLNKELIQAMGWKIP